MPRQWKPPQRNWRGIQFGSLRKTVDPVFNEVHDILTRAYYERTPFIWKGKDWGILDKATFDKLHGLIFHLRTLAFHRANLKASPERRIPEKKYNIIFDENSRQKETRTKIAAQMIKKLRQEGIKLEI